MPDGVAVRARLRDGNNPDFFLPQGRYEADIDGVPHACDWRVGTEQHLPAPR